MKIIRQGDSRVIKIIYRKKLNSEVEYRLSIFTYLYNAQGRYLIRNTLTFEVTELTETEWKTVSSLRERTLSLLEMEDKGIVELARANYIVPVDEDEAKQYEKVVFLLKTMQGARKGLRSFTIFPTTGCNARCT